MHSTGSKRRKINRDEANRLLSVKRGKFCDIAREAEWYNNAEHMAYFIENIGLAERYNFFQAMVNSVKHTMQKDPERVLFDTDLLNEATMFVKQACGEISFGGESLFIHREYRPLYYSLGVNVFSTLPERCEMWINWTPLNNKHMAPWFKKIVFSMVCTFRRLRVMKDIVNIIIADVARHYLLLQFGMHHNYVFHTHVNDDDLKCYETRPIKTPMEIARMNLHISVMRLWTGDFGKHYPRKHVIAVLKVEIARGRWDKFFQHMTKFASAGFLLWDFSDGRSDFSKCAHDRVITGCGACCKNVGALIAKFKIDGQFTRIKRHF